MDFSGKNCLRNSPVYAWPVRHWTSRPKTSRWSLSSMKCFVGFRDGGILLAIANLPLWGDFCQLRAQAVCVDALARRRANALEVLIGAFHASCVASLASSSALSLPAILQWLGHHAIVIVCVGSSSRRLERIVSRLQVVCRLSLSFTESMAFEVGIHNCRWHHVIRQI